MTWSTSVTRMVWRAAVDPTITWTVRTTTGGDGGGASLSNATPQPAGTATAGVGTAASRDDHRHAMPTASDVGAQPVDSDLTAIAALSTTSYGRAFLALVDAAAARTALGLGTAAAAATGDFQAADADLTTIAGLTANTDSFIQAKAGAWSARTIAQVKTDLGVGSPLAAQPRTSGVYYTLAGSEGASANAMPSAAGQLRAHPVWLPAGAYNRIGIFTTVAAASTVRLGVYPNNAATMVPDGQTLLFDGGTVNTNATAGLLEITVSFTIPADGVYWLASLCDAYTATPTGIGWQGTVGATPNLPWHGNQAYGSPGGRGFWARTLNSVTTGAMPATFPTASGADTRIQQIVVRAT
jgi:hypothetical protein